MGDVQVAYLMKLIKWHFWILKKHDTRIANSFGEILFENPQIYKECIGSLTFCHPVILQFSITAIFFLLLISKSWNLNKLLKSNWYIRLHRLQPRSQGSLLPAQRTLGTRLHLLWVNFYANEQKYKQWRHDKSAYSSQQKVFNELFSVTIYMKNTQDTLLDISI